MLGWRATWRQNASPSGISTPQLIFLIPNRCLKQVFAISYIFQKRIVLQV